jgi:uncharacterized membrane protein YfcA
VSEIVIFAVIGFVAQMIDGALGMAFGVIASTSLIAFGVPPAFASAAVHAAEIVTTGISGASHVWHRNVHKALFLRLVVAGVIGGVLGAFVLTGLPEEIIKPVVTVYLIAMAVLILARVRGWNLKHNRPPTPVVGAAGGFLDAVGGGGWGPIVASTLIATGGQPRRSIGSVNLAEFFVTLAISAAFFSQIDLASYGRIVLGLILGGMLAAPLAGYFIRILPMRYALLLVGCVISALSVVNVWSLLR